MRAKPLRELGTTELNKYAFDALLTWGNESVFKHSTPRLYEWFLADEPPINPEILFSKFRYARWRAWPVEEQSAVEKFLHALWADVLSNPSDVASYVDVESWLCSIAQSDDLASYLDQWLAMETEEAASALSALLITSAVVLPDAGGRNAFWRGREQQYLQLQDWAKSTAVEQALTRAQTRTGKPALIEDLGAALMILR